MSEKGKRKAVITNAMYACRIKHEVVILLRGLVVHQQQQPSTMDPGKGDIPFFNNHPSFIILMLDCILTRFSFLLIHISLLHIHNERS